MANGHHRLGWSSTLTCMPLCLEASHLDHSLICNSSSQDSCYRPQPTVLIFWLQKILAYLHACQLLPINISRSPQSIFHVILLAPFSAVCHDHEENGLRETPKRARFLPGAQPIIQLCSHLSHLLTYSHASPSSSNHSKPSLSNS